MLVALVEVNLNFNRITDLSPLHDCELLEKLFASHNEVESIQDLDTGCPKLRELALFSNRLEDNDELMKTLRGLPDLRELYIGENTCCAAPSQRYSLLCELPSLEVFDGQKISVTERKFAAAFLESASNDNVANADTADLHVSENLPRPVTAPSICARPPLPPSHNNATASVSLAPLPGQKLRSSRANRIDEVLTQSREASQSPEIAESRIPTFDLQSIDLNDPARALTLLTTHHAALKQCLDTMQIDRENLRFQVRLLEQDDVAQQVDRLRADVERLEVENRSSEAVQSENAQLQARLAEIEKQLSGTSSKSRPSHTDSVEKQDSLADDDTISELRWENKRLEKRLDQMRKYSEQLRHNFLCAKVRTRDTSSPQGASGAKVEAKVKLQDDTADPELSTILADNEAMLRRLQGDVSQTVAGKPPHPSAHAGLVKHVQCAQVDVLTLASEGSEDVEYHGKASQS